MAKTTQLRYRGFGEEKRLGIPRKLQLSTLFQKGPLSLFQACGCTQIMVAASRV